MLPKLFKKNKKSKPLQRRRHIPRYEQSHDHWLIKCIVICSQGRKWSSSSDTSLFTVTVTKASSVKVSKQSSKYKIRKSLLSHTLRQYISQTIVKRHGRSTSMAEFITRQADHFYENHLRTLNNADRLQL